MSNTSYKQIIPATDWYFRHDKALLNKSNFC